MTVYDSDFALYINGTIEEVAGLAGAIDDSTDTLYLGQIAPGMVCIIMSCLGVLGGGTELTCSH